MDLDLGHGPPVLVACSNVKKQTISVICILSRKSIRVKIYYTEKNRIKIPLNPA